MMMAIATTKMIDDHNNKKWFFCSAFYSYKPLILNM